MADLKETSPSSLMDGETPGSIVGTPTKKTRRSKTLKASTPTASKSASASSSDKKTADQTRKTRQVFSREERSDRLSKIAALIEKGESVKAAVAKIGVSEQTYYHWKKNAEPAAGDANLKDLLTLEEENKRLKKLLAERLRKENAELRKKLGLK